MILDVAGKEFLADEGDSITDADRQSASSRSRPDGSRGRCWSPSFVERSAGQCPAGSPRARASRRKRYEASPANLGLLCVRHILVETEEDAQAVLDELADGADFEQVAAERSTDTGSAQSGGALEAQPGQPCIPLEQAESALDATFFEAAAGVPGEPVGLVQTPFGWHVILARPYDEVALVVDSAVGQQLFDEHMATITIEVDPRYGRWDSDEGLSFPVTQALVVIVVGSGRVATITSP